MGVIKVKLKAERDLKVTLNLQLVTSQGTRTVAAAKISIFSIFHEFSEIKNKDKV